MAGIYCWIEGWDFGTSLYFQYITYLTIGFGDVVPQKEEVSFALFLQSEPWALTVQNWYSFCDDFFLKENVSGFRLNLVQFYSYLPGSFCAIAVFQLNWWIILEKIHFIVSSATNGGVIYRFQYLLQDPTWCFNCSFPFVTFINSDFQRKISLSSSFKFIHAFCKSVSLICIVSF